MSETPEFAPLGRIISNGVFISVPEALQVDDDGIKHAVKMEFSTSVSKQGRNIEFTPMFSTNRLLFDLSSVDHSSIDLDRVMKDCDLLKDIIKCNPDLIGQMLRTFTGPEKDLSLLLEVAKSLEKVGFTEQSFKDKGGGFIPLLIMAVAALLASGCAHTNWTVKKDKSP